MPKLFVILAAIVSTAAALAEVPALPKEALVIHRVRQAGRAATRSDPIEHRIVLGTWQTPRAGDVIDLPDGAQRTWETAGLDADGRLDATGLRGAYVLVTVQAAADEVVLLNARGHSMVYVNGSPRAGDPYGYGFLNLPIALRAGANELLFSCSRGGLQVRLAAPPAEVYLQAEDLTAPDHLDDGGKWLGVVVVNATRRWHNDRTITPVVDGQAQAPTDIGPLAPLTIRKVPVRVAGGPKLQLQLDGAMPPLDVTLRERTASDVHTRTFRSAADGSVQYYAVRPATEPGPDNALILSLHGAGVEALGQAEAYGPHTWATIVCPTNRRKFGFDWEDWGRIDALEVLAEAEKRYPHDPRRTCLTGHSMGGHGVWQLAALYPDRWAAIGPSAGWISFTSYAGADRPAGADPLAEILRAATGTSDTLAMVRNLHMPAVFVLHGDADDNVPVGQARAMRARLADTHPDFHYHEQEGAGHWWDGDPEPGAACVDFKPMFDLFEKSRRPATREVTSIDFTTVSPEVSGRCHWVTIVGQAERLRPSRVRARWDAGLGRIDATLENVDEIAFDLEALGVRTATITLNGTETTGTGPFLKAGDRWLDLRMVTRTRPDTRGSFKGGFWNRGPGQDGPLLVTFGASGSEEMKRAQFDKARFDAETFYYRGNGNVMLRPAERGGPQGVGYYGAPFTEPVVTVAPGRVRLGEAELPGADLAVLARGYQRVDVVGTGPVGVRLTHRMPYFVSGIDYPDVIVFGPEMLIESGLGGIRAARLGPRQIPAGPAGDENAEE